ncbi:phytanoyl-CoA dioxygenase family protein [Planctomicrobium piriforme]|uniref:Phytanoyl-CoA hydroxylase n=1 Tax=Planctomicrobium piriforme TaxID=1576369 RepID=A0A1I3RH25_9PLAN|nr:phytanoyl-CoA dioxygenase family protein [Planctomicrobium piriforme]SFJ45924.1 phytanoyl-CoA hydroxylase [Planctomicrobium piriforme]
MVVEGLIETMTPAPEFSSAEIAQFHEQGFAIVRNLGSAELCARMTAITDDGLHRRIEPLELETELKYPGAPESVAGEGGGTIRRLKQALSRDIVFTEWLQYAPLLTRLKQLLGPEVVCPLAHHNCIMTKEPRFSSDTGWHQDLRYWSFVRPDLISVWLALGPERKENGCLQVIPGSHRMPLPASSFDSALFYRSDLPENEPVLAKRELVELNPGDVLFFHAKTLHAATRNFSTRTKYSVVFTFRAMDNPPTPNSRSSKSPELLLH